MYQINTINFVDIKTGEMLTLDVAIVDRGNHPVSGSIVSRILRGLVITHNDQKIQMLALVLLSV